MHLGVQAAHERDAAAALEHVLAFCRESRAKFVDPVCHTGLEPQTCRPQTGLVCYSHVRALPWTGVRAHAARTLQRRPRLSGGRDDLRVTAAARGHDGAAELAAARGDAMAGGAR
eukprot:scaffold21045_cov59-Phaeocystis_antarctica.AAC.3